MADILKKLFYSDYDTESDYSMSDDDDDSSYQTEESYDDETSEFDDAMSEDSMQSTDIEPEMEDDEPVSLPTRLDFHLDDELPEDKGKKF